MLPRGSRESRPRKEETGRQPFWKCSFVTRATNIKAFWHTSGTLVQIPNTVTSLNALHSLITLGFSYLHWNLMCTKEFRARRSFVQYFIPYYSFSKITLKTLVMTRRNIYFRSSVTFSLYWCTPLAAAKVECIPTAYLTSSERGRYCE